MLFVVHFESVNSQPEDSPSTWPLTNLYVIQADSQHEAEEILNDNLLDDGAGPYLVSKGTTGNFKVVPVHAKGIVWLS